MTNLLTGCSVSHLESLTSTVQMGKTATTEIHPKHHRTVRKLVVIDSGVDNLGDLLTGVKPDYAVEMLMPERSGIAQISEILSRYQGLETLHLVSHGRPGEVQLGNDWLTLEKLTAASTQVIGWADSLANTANVLVYGCEVAKGDRGQSFVALLEELLGTTVFAANHLVGHDKMGGCWQLATRAVVIEQTVKSIEGNCLAFGADILASYQATFAAPSHDLGPIDPKFTQIGTELDGEAPIDKFGEAVSLSADGTTLAVGAIGNDIAGNDSGSVSIYKNINGNWQLVGTAITGELPGDKFGSAVSLSDDGNTVAIGAKDSDGNGQNNGQVSIFQNVGGTWTQVGTNISGQAVGDRIGSAITLSANGSIVAIGTAYNDGNGTSSGHVRLFENIGGTWTQIGADIDGAFAGDQSGNSIALSADGSIVAIGASRNDDNGNESGHVSIYQNNGGVWMQVHSAITGEATGDNAGTSVAISADGSTVAVGSISNDGNGADSGHVRIFQNVGGTWQQVGANIEGESAGDSSGYDVSLSDDGTRVAISTIANGNFSGQVRVYDLINGNWQQIDVDLNGESAADRFGQAISLSGDGSTLAVGAPFNDANGRNSGQVRVFNIALANPSGLKDDLVDLSGIIVTDGDGDLTTTQLTVANGVLTVSLSDGASISAGENSSATLTLSGNATQINAALATLTYQRQGNFFGTDTLTITSTDSATNTTTDTIPIKVTAGSTQVTLEAGNLQINSLGDLSNVEGLTLTEVNGMLRISDPNFGVEAAGPGVIQIDANTVEIPLADITGNIMLSPLTDDSNVLDASAFVKGIDIEGGEGDETIRGGQGQNRLFGNGGNDNIFGSSKRDIIHGGAGADDLDGGAGKDILGYLYSPEGVTVNLLTGQASGGDAEGDTFANFEQLVGSEFNDRLIGDNANNFITGRAGDDLIRGRDGDDTIAGGEGADNLSGGGGMDTLSYIWSSAGVVVDLANNTASGGDANGDTIDGFESVRGSDFNDTLTGSSKKNFLYGNAGDDTIDGGGGNDLIRGGEGGDDLDGGAGSQDTLDYRDSSAGVTINLGNNTATGGDATGDTIANFENVNGSKFNDVLTGSNKNNYLSGYGGADTLTGGNGEDIFFIDQLADTLLGNHDHITDLAIGQDSIDGVTAVAAGTINMVGNVLTLDTSGIGAVLDGTTFAADSAAIFTFGSGASTQTFLALNNSRKGFQANRDGIIEITGFTGAISDLAIG